MISYNMGRLYRSNYQNKNTQLEKLKHNELKIEDILEDDEIVNEIKSNNSSEFSEFFSNEVIRQLIDYATKMPRVDELKIGHKFPYNACEILCSDNSFILDRIFEVIKIQLEDNESGSRKDSNSSDQTESSNEKSDDSSKSEQDKDRRNSHEIKDEDKNNPVHISSNNQDNLTINESDYVQKLCSSKEDSEGKNEIELQTNSTHTENNDKKPTEELTTIELRLKNEEECQPQSEENITTNIVKGIIASEETILIENYLVDKQESTSNDNNNDKISEEESTEDKKDNDDDDDLEIDYNPDKRRSIPRHKKNAPITSDFFKEEQIEETLNVSQAISIHKEEEEDLSKYKLIYETLDYFYLFLESSLPLDYVLVGYFYKIFNHLLNSRTEFINYIFIHRPDILDNLIKHTNRKAIGECLQKILMSRCDGIGSAHEIKLNIVKNLINVIREEKNFEKVEIITELLQECMNNKRFFELFMSNLNVLSDIHRALFDNIEDKEISKFLLKLLIRINEFIKKEFGNPVTPGFTSDNHYEIYSLLTMDCANSIEDAAMNLQNLRNEDFIITSLEHILKILTQSTLDIVVDFMAEKDNSLLDTTYDKPVKKVGIVKLNELEYFRSVLDIILNSYALNMFHDVLNTFVMKLIDIKFFYKLVEEFYSNVFNSYYQRLFLEVIILCSNEHSPVLLIEHLFSKDIESNCNLLHSIVDHLDQDLFFTYSSGMKISSGLYGVLCEIINNIVSSRNVHLKEIVSKDDEFKFFVSTFIDPAKMLFTKKLLLNRNFESNEEGFSHLEVLNEKICEVNEKEGTTKEEEMYTSKSLKEIFYNAYDLLERRRNPTQYSEPYDNYNPIEEDYAFQLETRDKSIEYITNADAQIFEVKQEKESDDYNNAPSTDLNTKFYDNLYWTHDMTLDSKSKSNLMRELDEL